MIREVGIIFRGYLISYLNFIKNDADKYYLNKISFFLSAITAFSKNMFSEDILYFEGLKYTIVINREKINSIDNTYNEDLIAFVVLDKQNKTDKIIENKINPILEKVMSRFKSKYDGKNLAETTQFTPFKSEMSSIFQN